MSPLIVSEIITLLSAFNATLKSSAVYELARKRRSDFTRSKRGKLPLPKLLAYVISRHCKDTNSESRTFWEDIRGTGEKPSREAVNKRLHCLNPQVWPYLSKEFARLFYKSDNLVKTMKGYVVLGADSSAVEMPYSEKAANLYGFHKCNHVKKPSDSGKIIARCGGLYDLINRLYVDYVITAFKRSEMDIVKEQLRSFSGILAHRKTILLADRGYIALELMAYAQMLGYKFCIRAKKSTYKAVVARMKSEDEYIEIQLNKSIIRRISDPEVKQYLSELDVFRVRAIKKYVTNPETGAQELGIYFTNIPPEEFTTKEIYDLYASRWNIELGYLTLKTVLELERHVSLDPEIAVTDIYGKIMFYNFSALFRQPLEHLLKEDDQRVSPKSGKPSKKNKYKYQISAKNLIQELYSKRIVNCLVDAECIKQLITNMMKHLIQSINQLKEPVREGRHYKRWGKAVTASYKYKFKIDGRNHPKVAVVGGVLRTVKP